MSQMEKLKAMVSDDKLKSVMTDAYAFQAMQLIAEPSDNHQGKLKSIAAYLKLMDRNNRDDKTSPSVGYELKQIDC